MPINFLNVFRRRRRPKKQSKRHVRIVKITLLSLGGIVVFLGILGVVSYAPGRDAYQAALRGKENFDKAQSALSKQDFNSTVDYLHSANSEFDLSMQRFSKIRYLRFIPIIGKQISAIQNILLTVSQTGRALESVGVLGRDILQPFEQGTDLQFAHLSRKEKEQIFKQIADAQPTLINVRQQIATASQYLRKVPSKGLIGPVRKIVKPIQEQFPTFERSIYQAIDLSDFIPKVAGYPSPKTYLFLLQNNTEMRPTGGFIGTYGILKIVDGEIDSFTTDNVYNLDSQVEGKLFVTPPWPLTRYNDVKNWYLRDANWSPDFPTSAEQAIWFYEHEGGKEKVDGAIAITPSLIESLLGLVGDVEVDGVLFTQENFVSTLEYQVEQGYLRQGVPAEQRKEVIGSLSKVLMQRLLSLPRSQWQKLWSTIAINLAEKQMLIYEKEPTLQDRVRAQNWDGAIQSTTGDFLMVVDANLASLKSDPAVKRTIDYSLDASGDTAHATVTIAYSNTGKLSWKTTRYRTYVRVLVPAGSQLTSSDGSMVDCKLSTKGSVEVTEESGKTSFGAFVCTEIGETKTLRLSYDLPKNVVNGKTYTLLAQKQPGTIDNILSVHLKLPASITYVEPLDKAQVSNHTDASFVLPLRQDRHILIQHK